MRPAVKIACAVLALLLAAPGWAAGAPAAGSASGPDVLPPQLESRYQALTEQLRCPVCQNEPIATSQAQIAGALRDIVRKRLRAGETNQQIKDYMISRYGLFAVYKPPLERGTFLLWFGPLILFLIALVVAGLAIRKRRRALVDSGNTR